MVEHQKGRAYGICIRVQCPYLRLDWTAWDAVGEWLPADSECVVKRQVNGTKGQKYVTFGHRNEMVWRSREGAKFVIRIEMELVDKLSYHILDTHYQ